MRGSTAGAARGNMRPQQPGHHGHGHSRKGSGASSASNSSSNIANGGQPAGSAQSAGPAASAAVNVNLQEVLGAELELTVNNAAGAQSSSSKVQGTLWTYDASMGCLVLSTASSSSFRIIRLSSITNITVLSLPSAPINKDETLPAVDLSRVKEREINGVKEELRAIEREAPQGTSELGKELYDAFAKTMTVRWTQERTIIVLEEVVVSPPYRVEDAKSPKGTDPRILERVKKVLQGERDKLSRLKPELLKEQAEG